MKIKKVLSMLLAMAVATTSVSVYNAEPVFAAEATTTVSNETPIEKNYVYGTMKIPYAAFYEAELGETNKVAVDAVTSATASKWKTQKGTYTEAAAEGNGGTILGVEYFVAIERDTYEELKSTKSTLLDTFTEIEQIPATYKVMDDNGNFSAVQGEVSKLNDVTAALATTSRYGDYQLNMSGLNLTGTVYGAVVKTTDGTKYALRHLENIWRNGMQLSWSTGFSTTESHGNQLSYEHYKSMMGKTIDSVEFICNDGVYTVNDIDAYVPFKYNGTFEIADAATTDKQTAVTMTGFPAEGTWELVLPESLIDASYENGVIKYSENSLPGSYTVTAKDTSNVYAESSASFVISTSDMPVQFKDNAITAVNEEYADSAVNYLKNISRVAVKYNGKTTTYSASGKGATTIINNDGTVNFEAASRDAAVFEAPGTYDLTVTSTGYDAFTFSVEVKYVYGTMNIPYEAFYAAEIGTSNDVEVDAVTSATNAKWKNFAGSYSQADEEGEGGKILGAKYNVAIESSVYETLKSADSSLLDSFTESTEVPDSYKIMDADGNFSEVKGKSTEAEGVTAELSTSSVWGDYQLTLTGLTMDAQKVAGAIIETTDGTKYGLRHLENIWIKATELAWGSGFKTTEAKGNVLSYAHYVSLMGKTISKVTYICTDGNVTVSDLNVYVPVKYNGTFEIADSAQTAGASAVTMTGFPEDGNWQLDLPEGLKNASYENRKISYGAGTLPGAYTVTAKDANNVYAQVSTSFNVTTNTLPVQFKNGKIIGLENTPAEETSNFIKNIASVTVKFGDSTASYSATGHGAVAVIAEDGTVNMDAGSRGKVVFAEDGTYELTVTSNGYPKLTFTVEKKTEVTPVPTAVPTKTATPTAVPTKAVAPTKAATPTPTAKVTAPKKVTISKVSNTSSKKLKVVWKKVKSVSGYQVQIATNKKFTSGKKTYTIKKAATTSKTITGLKKKKTYYVRVRAYNTSGSKKVYGKYSAVKKITIKK